MPTYPLAASVPVDLVLFAGQSNVLAWGGIVPGGVAGFPRLDDTLRFFLQSWSFPAYLSSELENLGPFVADGTSDQYIGPWLRASADYADSAHPRRPILVSVFGLGGTQFSWWVGEGGLVAYRDAWLATILAAFGGSPTRIHFVWIHGENDAALGNGSTYYAYQVQLIEEIRAILGPSVFFHIVGLHSEKTEWVDLEVVRAAQQQVASEDPLVWYVEPNSITPWASYAYDYSHYNSTGLDLLGHLIGTSLLAAGGGNPVEFDVEGALYYAVAPVGYSFTNEQTAQYSTRKYNTLLAAAAALLASPTTPQVINVLGAWSVADGNAVSLYNIATTASNFLLIRGIGQARHSGKYSATAFDLNVNNGAAASLNVYTSYTTIEGLQISNTGTPSPASCVAIRVASGANIVLDALIVRGANAAVNNYNAGIYIGEASASIDIRNCIFYDWQSTSPGYSVGVWSGSGAIVTLQNNTIFNCGTAIYWSSENASSTSSNTLIQDCAQTYVGNIRGGTNNCVDAGPNQGTNPVTGTAVFVDEVSRDLHLDLSDTTAFGAGSNLSAFFGEDVDGEPRLFWSIGADDGPTTPLLATASSVGTSTVSATGAPKTQGVATAAGGATTIAAGSVTPFATAVVASGQAVVAATNTTRSNEWVRGKWRVVAGPSAKIRVRGNL